MFLEVADDVHHLVRVHASAHSSQPYVRASPPSLSAPPARQELCEGGNLGGRIHNPARRRLDTLELLQVMGALVVVVVVVGPTPDGVQACRPPRVAL